MEKEEMIPLTKEEKLIFRNDKFCHICKKQLSNYNDDKKYYKVQHHIHY